MLPADVVVVCAGVWTPHLAATVDLRLPVVPMEHQYAVTTDIPELAANAGRWATMPIVRHHDIGIYFRDHGAAVGIGSFHHRGLPVEPAAIDGHERNADGTLAFAWTPEDWKEAWDLVTGFMPALADAELTTTDQRHLRVHARRLPGGRRAPGDRPGCGSRPRSGSRTRRAWCGCSPRRSCRAARTWTSRPPTCPGSTNASSTHRSSSRGPTTSTATSTWHTTRWSRRPRCGTSGSRRSPAGSGNWGRSFFNVATWERPQWFDANADLATGLPALARDEWSSRHWSPIVVAEHLATRERAGLFDMTPLYRIEVAGAGAAALLDRLVAGTTDRPVGSVVYSVMLDDRGGISSDVTVARLEPDRFWVGGNGPRDLAWLRDHAPRDGSVTVRPVWDKVASVGLWGPRARDIAAPLADADLSDRAFPFMTAQRIGLAGIGVTAVRISYAGELGWELTCAASDGVALWDALWSAGAEHGLVAAGRGALGSLRLEKGYRAWGSDLTPEHGPVESGLGWAVRRDGSPFLGDEAATVRDGARRLRCLVLDGEQVAMGSEPVLAGGEAAGYVTSAAWGPSVGASLALAWVDATLVEGDAIEVGYLGRRLPGRIGPDRPFDPTGARLTA